MEKFVSKRNSKRYGFKKDDEMKYYPITRSRAALTQKYIEEQVRNGLIGYDTFKKAQQELSRMCTDDCDYEVCFFDGTEWKATRDGKTVLRREIP